MFLSSINGSVEVEHVNMDYLKKSLKAQNFEIIKLQNQELEIGLNTLSFYMERNGLIMVVFIMRMNKNQFVCAGYYNGIIVQEKDVKYESDIPSTLLNIFNSIKVRQEDQIPRFDIALDNVRIEAEKIEQRQKNHERFVQEVKTSQDYQYFKELEKKAYLKIIKDSEYIINSRDDIKARNSSLIDPILDIETRKGALQSTIIAFEEGNQNLLNVKQKLKDHIEELKKKGCQLTPGNFNQYSLNEYLQALTKIKKCELQLNHFVG